MGFDNAPHSIPIVVSPSVPLDEMHLYLDGKLLGAVINIDIETCGLSPRGELPMPDYISGEIVCDLKFHPDGFIHAMRRASKSVLELGNAWLASGKMNRHERKRWRKYRLRLIAEWRRDDARDLREAHGLATF